MNAKAKRKTIPNVISALTARTQFGQVMDRVSQHGERFLVRHRNGETAVILSLQNYLTLLAPEDPVVAQLRAEASRKGLDKLTTAEIEAEIATVRRERAGADAKKQRSA